MHTMKILAAAALSLVSAVAFAQTTPPATPPGGGIKGTKHDWSATGRTSLLQWVALDKNGVPLATPTTYVTGTAYIDPATNVQGKVSVTIGLCTKCHTPHQALSTNLLWNHTLQSTQYKWDVPDTTAGTKYPTFRGDTYKGASTKCLSCHDGLMSSTDGMWFNRQRTAGSKYVDPNPNALDSGHEVAKGAMMSGSHPVAFPYPFNNAPSSYNGTSTGTAAETDEFQADPTQYGIRLFNDDGSGNIIAGANGSRTGMECTSCHDVHNGKRAVGAMLLTGQLTGSTQSDGYICLQCHIK